MGARAVAPCGSHAAVHRHRRVGEPLCPQCRAFIRGYDVTRKLGPVTGPPAYRNPLWTDPGWMDRAACMDRPDIWCERPDGGAGRDGRSRVAEWAARLCRETCPVLTECRGWAAGKTWAGVVIGGWVAPDNAPTKPPWGKDAGALS